MDSLKFGTSGLRGLAVGLQGQAARRYTAAFLRHLDGLGAIVGDHVYLARDFRPSSEAIAADCAAAIEAHGLRAVDCGALPTPALALHAMAAQSPSIMITGSHIPADRNGLKFYTPSGEISKADEAGILAALRDEAVADAAVPVGDEHAAAVGRYVARFADLVPAGALRGWRIGVFEHSTVARDILRDVLAHAGAEIVPLGRVDGFVAVDTEAFGDAVFAPLKGWIVAEELDAIVSSDGDGDRPLLMDGQGAFVRGDVLGLLAARYLSADAVVTPVTSNSAIEKTGFFPQVIRTRVGSPFVVAGIEEAIAGGASVVVGFEANGGTLLGTAAPVSGGEISALPTRDAVLPMLSTLGLAVQRGVSVAELVAGLPLQYAASDRIEHVPADKSAALLGRLAGDADYAEAFFAPDHEIERLSQIDGLQFWTRAGEMVHFRASGNAPELRCYVESGSDAGARALLQWGLAGGGGCAEGVAVKVFVTGTAGFIGFHLTRRLLADGHSVTGYDGMTPFYDEGLKAARMALLTAQAGFAGVQGMLEDAAGLAEALRASEAEIVVHLAAQAGVRYSIEAPQTYISSNLVGTANLLEAVRAHKPRHLVFASTSSVYGGNLKMPFAETDHSNNPVSLYAATKKGGEAMVHAYAHLWDIASTSMRFFTVYGPLGRPDMAALKFVRAIEAGEAIDVYGEGQMRRDFTYIDDLVETIVRIMDRPPVPGEVVEGDTLSPVAPSRIVNLGGGNPRELMDFIAAIEAALGKKARLNFLPMQQGDVVETYSDVSLLRQLVGSVPQTPIEDGVARLVEWYRQFYS